MGGGNYKEENSHDDIRNDFHLSACRMRPVRGEGSQIGDQEKADDNPHADSQEEQEI